LSGPGRITFHVLVKEVKRSFPRCLSCLHLCAFCTPSPQGEANTGAFFRPNAAPLTLDQASASPIQSWFRGAAGESCDTACEGFGKTCNSAEMVAIDGDSRDAFENSGILRRHACLPPLMSGYGFLSYHSFLQVATRK
jgi:hypothetical protein